VQYNVLVNDPNTSAVEGDIITLAPETHSRHVHHTIAEIVAPFGKPLDERPALLTQAEREAIHAEARARKLARRAGKESPSTPITTAAQMVARRPVTASASAHTVGELPGLENGDAILENQPDANSSQKGVQVERGEKVTEEGGHSHGKIQHEAQAGRQRAVKWDDQAAQNAKDLEDAKARPQEEVAREALRQ